MTKLAQKKKGRLDGVSVIYLLKMMITQSVIQQFVIYANARRVLKEKCAWCK